MRKVVGVHNFLRNLHPVLFVLLFTLLIFGLSLLFNLIVHIFDIPNIDLSFGDKEIEKNISNYIFITTIVPLIETLVFQKLIYWILAKFEYFKSNKYWIIVVSAVIFGLQHYSSVHYLIVTFLIGVIYMYIYILKVGKQPYWTTFAVHSLYNLIAMLLR